MGIALRIEIIVIGIAAIIVLVLSVNGMRSFKSFCAELAQLQGRVAEFEISKGTDENSLNEFERQVHGKLMVGDFREFGDHDMQLRARRVAAGLRLMWLVSVLFIVFIAFIFRRV
jgi:hypothetical protein